MPQITALIISAPMALWFFIGFLCAAFFIRAGYRYKNSRLNGKSALWVDMAITLFLLVIVATIAIALFSPFIEDIKKL